MIDPLEDSTGVTVVGAGMSVDDILSRPALQLVVLDGGTVGSHPLPATGTVVIGRSRKCDVRVDDDSISRQHAVIYLGDKLGIEDLGSVNGTLVRGAKLGPKRRVELGLGELIQVGGVSVLVQERSTPVRLRRVWSHDYFHARVEDECVRPQGQRAGFLVLRVITHGPATPLVVQHCLADFLRKADIIGTYGPHEYDILLCDAPPERADEIVKRISTTLQRKRMTTTIRVAAYPRDGRTSHALIAHLAGTPAGAPPGTKIIVEPAMRDLHAMAERIATSELGVLLLGETGVGKEIFAKTIHTASGRTGPFVAINCAALTDSLLESELFGHEKGAFTSAVTSKPGLLETADDGTVLLDEVGDMPLSTQAKLLRVIEDGQLRRVGGVTSQQINVRFLAATNRDLQADVERGAFRRDLYFRLNGVTLVIPPLRDRPSEIEPLARSFAERAAGQAGHPVPDFAPETVRLLGEYPWPGNIRELRNVIERAVALCGSGAIGPEHVPTDRTRETILTTPAARPRVHARRGPDEYDQILAALERAEGNQTVAAKLLNISRRTLVNRLNEFGLPRPRKSRS